MAKSATAICLLVLFIFAGCSVKPTMRQIADSIQLDKEWTELRPTPPLVVSEQVQSIAIAMPNLPDWEIRPKSASFVMPGGTPIKIEVELLAADGARFMLDSVGLGQGLLFSRRPQDPSPSASRLPSGMAFTSVRLRSDQPLQGGRVMWICITNY